MGYACTFQKAAQPGVNGGQSDFVWSPARTPQSGCGRGEPGTIYEMYPAAEEQALLILGLCTVLQTMRPFYF